MLRKPYHFHFILFLTLCLSFSSCIRIERDSIKEPRETVVATTQLNLREGPSINHKKIGLVEPNEQLELINRASENPEWIYVETNSGQTGYVSSKYTQPVYVEEVLSVENDAVTDVHDDNDNVNIFTAYPKFVTDNPLPGLSVIAIIFVIQGLICKRLNKRYDYILNSTLTYKRPLKDIILAILISFALTAFQAVGIFMLREKATSDDILYTLILLSTGLVMATMPWRIFMSGRMNITDDDCPERCTWGRVFSEINWGILLIPICVFMWQLSDWFQISKGEDSFLVMLFDSLLYLLFCAIIAYAWTGIIVKDWLSSMGSVVLSLFTVFIFISIGKVAYNFCDESYTMITYIISLFLFIGFTISGIMIAIQEINEKRCDNCHSYVGEQTGSTDMGSSWKTESHWEATDSSGITRRHKNSDISDAEVHVRETYRTDKWRTHHVCWRCSHTWDIDHDEEVLESRQITGQRWKETYID